MKTKTKFTVEDIRSKMNIRDWSDIDWSEPDRQERLIEAVLEAAGVEYEIEMEASPSEPCAHNVYVV